MRRIGWALLAAAASGSVAHADGEADVETLEGQQRELGLGSRLTVAPGGLRWSAFAQLVGEGAAELGDRARSIESAAAVGAELRVVSPRCDLVRVGGQARLAWSGSARPSAEQWASGCIASDAMSAELGHHLEWDVRPSLLAPIQLRAGLNRRETVHVHLEPLHVPLAYFAPPEERSKVPPAYLALFELDVRILLLWSEGTPIALHQQPEAVGIRYEREQIAPWGERRNFAVDIIAGGGEFTEEGAAVHAWVVRLENLAIGPVLATGGIGVASAGVGPFVDGTRRQIEVTAARALASVETGGDLLHGYVRGLHDVGLTPDGFAVKDARLSSGLALEATGTRVELDGFLARTQLYILDLDPVRGTTGGASLALARGLGAHLEATVRLEAARSFYALAPDAMAAEPGPPRWGATAIAALQATAGR